MDAEGTIHPAINRIVDSRLKLTAAKILIAE